MEITSLDKLRRGQTGQILELPPGRQVSLRLSEMGLRVGSILTIKNIMPMRGPILIAVGQTQIALGHGTARKIQIEVK